MLRYYRRYDQPYDKKPRVAFAGISSSPKPTSIASMEWQATLQHDQIALIFHLRPALHSKTAIKELLNGAEPILQSRVDHIRGLESPETKYLDSQPQLDRPNFLWYLRLLDATSDNEGDNTDVAKFKWMRLANAPWIIKEKRWSGPRAKIAENIRKMVDDSAKPFTEFRYIAIATAAKRHEKMPAAEQNVRR